MLTAIEGAAHVVVVRVGRMQAAAGVERRRLYMSLMAMLLGVLVRWTLVSFLALLTILVIVL